MADRTGRKEVRTKWKEMIAEIGTMNMIVETGIMIRVAEIMIVIRMITGSDLP